MEEGRKIEHAQALYRQRLQNLPKIITQLHEIVKSDEILSSLKDSTMEKYRIDRVNEIVADILNSEKQKMLIKVLQKYSQQSLKLKQQQEKYQMLKTNSTKQSSYYDSWLEVKQKNEKEMIKCRLLLDEKTEIIQKMNKELSELRQKKNEKTPNTPVKLPEKCNTCQSLKGQLFKSESQAKLAKQFVEKLKKDGQSAVQILNQQINKLKEKNQQLESDLIKKSSAVTRENRQDCNNKNDNAKRNQKVEVMRRQIAFLQEQLIQVQKQFNVIKDLALGDTLVEVRKLQNSHRKLKQFIFESLRNTAKQNRNDYQKIITRLLNEADIKTDNLKPERLMAKLNHIQNELDYFIENQIFAE